MSVLALVEPNFHRMLVNNHHMLFHVPTGGLFELDNLTCELINLFSEREEVSAALVREQFTGSYRAEDVAEALSELKSLRLIAEPGKAQINADVKPVTCFPLTTVVLNTNTGCNLGCNYCYKEDLSTPSNGSKMEFDTAVKAVELMLAQSPDQRKYNVVFFGGEPLTNIPLIKQVVAYCEQRFDALGSQVSFTMTTNGTLLNEALVDWLDHHRFGLTISMDGPKAVHDKNRITVGGRGTYDLVRRKMKMLLPRYRSRPVGCRVTLSRGNTNVEDIFDHLSQELGFAEVGFGPVTSSNFTDFNLTIDEMGEVFAGMKRLGRRYLDAALAGSSLGFGNMHMLMTDIHEGIKKQLPCGAGVGLLAVDTQGGINLCHRFTGSDQPLFGDVNKGLDRSALAAFIGRRLDRGQTACETCRIRNICSGGCYHESYAKYGDAGVPSYHYCDFLRDWVEFGIDAYTRITLESPTFFETHVSPRRSA